MNLSITFSHVSEELELSDRPAILVILMYMVNDKQPFKIRVAALYCIQCFLYKNQKGQAAVVSTLLPDQEGFKSFFQIRK